MSHIQNIKRFTVSNQFLREDDFCVSLRSSNTCTCMAWRNSLLLTR